MPHLGDGCSSSCRPWGNAASRRGRSWGKGDAHGEGARYSELRVSCSLAIKITALKENMLARFILPPGLCAGDNEPPPASPPASFPLLAPKTCLGVLITSLMSVAFFNELFAGLGTVTVTPCVPKAASQEALGPFWLGLTQTGHSPANARAPLGHHDNAGAEQDLGLFLLQAEASCSPAI